MQVITDKRGVYGHLILTVLAALLLSLAWLRVTPLLLFVAFVPLLALAEGCSYKRYFGWISLALSLWMVFTQYWIYYATIAGVIASAVVQIVLFAPPFIIYKFAVARGTRPLAYTLFVSAWIAFEYIYTHNNQVSHPWVVLGNGFAEDVKLIQWYEYTGVFGGSLWVLIVNILILEFFRSRSRIKGAIIAITITLPMVISMIIYHSYDEGEKPVKIGVIQPNIDPYADKFSGMTQLEQNKIILSLMSEAPRDIKYLIAPETAVSDNINIDFPLYSRSVKQFHDYMATNFPNSELIIGATMFKFYPKSINPPTITARKSGTIYYDVINGALQLGSSGTEGYIKSKLVTGVEKLPFPKLMKNLKFGGIDLGGMSGALITQPDREVFKHGREDILVASPICYESIYGEYITEFVRNGADMIFIITNDGWWRDTHGYKHHYSYARLRAIENRRAIARSANTGISGFINQRGDDIATLGWDKRGILVRDININDNITFYTKYGDYIGRGALYLCALSLLYLLSYIYKKKSHLN